MMNHMLAYLEQTTAQSPERIAFFDDKESLSFVQLRDTARRIGTAISVCAGPRSPVALLIDSRSLRNLPAILGTLYAGCAYAPLDIAMPPERLRLLLEQMAPSAILADGKGLRSLEACTYEKTPVVSYEEAILLLPNDEALSAIRAQSSVYDPMSILYTSGSTGIPKGSIQNHFSYIHWMEATIEMYGFTEHTVFGNQSPFFYANSIFDIFPTIALGASTYLLPSGVLTFPKRLMECLRKHHVTALCMTPSSFISVANAGVLAPGSLPELLGGYMSGEPMPWQPLNTWMEASPNAAWWNFYGATEMFSVAVGMVCKNHHVGDQLPVGSPFPLVHVLFVDENGDEVPPGQPGEMLVSSPWIARGYHRDAARTSAAWVTDPLGCGWHERFYRAGDIGYRREDGQLVVIGRRDSQIKHMGYRMELGEVEAALRGIAGWVDGCVLFDRESDRIWCFFTGALTEKELKKGLKERLARYMLPDVFVSMDALPHTASMKVDRAKLTMMMKEGV